MDCSKKINLYLVTRTDNPGYGEFVGIVVASTNEESAKQTAYMAQYDHEYSEFTFPGDANFNADNIKVELIGFTDKFESGHIVIADFLHG